MPCDECERLWRAYENAVFEHVRLCAKLRLALATTADGAAEALEDEVIEAENKRAVTRNALTHHEIAARHGAHALAS
jgi:hypothetical protein